MKHNNDAWLSQHVEEVIDPEREIVDAHHHLFPSPEIHYSLEHLMGDTGSGHRVVETIFVDCGAGYRTDGPAHLAPVGETEFVAEAAMKSAQFPDNASIVGIVSHADLMSEHLDEVLDAHIAAGNKLFCGIRHSGACDPYPEALSIPGQARPKQFARDDFRAGVARLGERQLTFDTWIFHHQIPEFRELAEAVPETTMILDHFGMPIGVGPYADKAEEIFAQWKEDMLTLSECPNVYVKLGGLAMPDMGYGWHTRATPATSDEIVSAHSRWYYHAIDAFGAERCMFESNFPVDRQSVSYRTLWNAFKKIGATYASQEQDLLFSGVARKVYGLRK